jgi:hypothetical protein
MKKRIPIITAAFLCVFPCLAGGQEYKPLIEFVPLAFQGIETEEARIIESLIRSYLADRGGVITGGGPAARDFVPDYSISGRVSLERDGWVFVLTIAKSASGERIDYTSVHKTTGELVLRAKSLVETAFSEGVETAFPVENRAEPLTERGILGTWWGDPGIEMIHLYRNGRGTAILSSGALMRLEYVIEDDVLKVIQSSPNMERFYHPLPYKVARQLAAEAEPMRWELLLFNGGTLLRGIKIATEVRYREEAILELLPGSARDAEWTR